MSWLAFRVILREIEDLEESVDTLSPSDRSARVEVAVDDRVLVDIFNGRERFDLRNEVIIHAKS